MGADTAEQEEEWQAEKLQQQKEFNNKWANPVPYDVKMSDFIRFSLLGKGAFGAVYLVQKNGQNFAMKCMLKSDIVLNKQQDHAINEKKILSCVKFIFIIQLHYAFQDNAYLFLVCDCVMGGELFNLMRKVKRFPDNFVRFYSSQILLAFEYLHNLNIVYRDLKPENVLISADGYVKLADLGFAKVLSRDKRAWTLCGTPDYMAPEIILNKGYNLSVDWWSFGVFLYELTCGYPPFMQADQMKTFEKIVSGKFKCPPEIKSDLKSLIRSLLQLDLSRRFGNLKRGVSDIKDHAYYDDVNFFNTYHKTIDVPWKPKIKGNNDVSNFDAGKDEKLVEEPTDKYGKYFVDF